jgi:hypothetical protein
VARRGDGTGRKTCEGQNRSKATCRQEIADGPASEKLRIEAVNWAKTDPDLDIIRDHPRFKAMLAAAEARSAQP